ncbi:MAG: hypothetical protein AAFY71_09120 [Bacteroidota bacterium]
MEMTRIFCLILAVLLAVSASGQRTMLPSQTGMILSYVGDGFLNPGGKIGLDHAFYIKENRKEVPTNKGGYNRTLATQWIVQPSVGYYLSRKNHNAYFIQLESGLRNIYHRSTFRRFALRTDITIGAITGLYSASADASSADTRADFSGRIRLYPTAGFTLAQDYFVNNYTLPASFFVKAMGTYAQGTLYPGLEVGVLFRGLYFPPIPQKVKFTRN